MAVIYLKHPVHGYKVACGTAEADYDRSHGWVEYDPSAPKVVEPEVPAFLVPVEPVAPVAPDPPKAPKLKVPKP